MVISKPLYYVSVMAGLMTYFTVGTTLILTADLQPSTLFRAVEMYKVCQCTVTVQITQSKLSQFSLTVSTCILQY